MYSVDKTNEYGKYLLDEGRKIPHAHLKVACKKGCGKNTCRYIALSGRGHVCVKNTPLRIKIDTAVELAKQGHGKFSARGDNCEGFGQDGKTTTEKGE